jgi:RES domain-containing protein
MVYAADAPATALVETLVHADRADLLRMPYVVFEVSLNEDRHLLRLPSERLPADWQAWPWPAATQEIGTYWFASRASVVLEVPSAVVPYQRNYLINVQHPDFAALKIAGPMDFPIDPRLAGTGSS